MLVPAGICGVVMAVSLQQQGGVHHCKLAYQHNTGLPHKLPSPLFPRPPLPLRPSHSACWFPAQHLVAVKAPHGILWLSRQDGISTMGSTWVPPPLPPLCSIRMSHTSYVQVDGGSPKPSTSSKAGPSSSKPQATKKRRKGDDDDDEVRDACCSRHCSRWTACHRLLLLKWCINMTGVGCCPVGCNESVTLTKSTLSLLPAGHQPPVSYGPSTQELHSITGCQPVIAVLQKTWL